MATVTTISINRAPVLTLWAAVVAERMGFDRDETLSFGRAVAGLKPNQRGVVWAYSNRTRRRRRSPATAATASGFTSRCAGGRCRPSLPRTGSGRSAAASRSIPTASRRTSQTSSGTT
jgi:hypothetical protein